jgi:hypothetical protein
MNLRLILLTLAGLAMAPAAFAQAADDELKIKGVTDEADGGHAPAKAVDAASAENAKRYSRYAGRKFPTRVYFGDTHNHTANSGDAFGGGARLSPEQAYRFARGEEVAPPAAFRSSCRARWISSSFPTTPRDWVSCIRSMTASRNS